MSKDDLILGHASSRPLSADEVQALEKYRLMKLQAERQNAERKEKLKGYLFWCSEGCGFVDEHHQCEQWSHITYIPPEAVKAIRESQPSEAQGREGAKEGRP